MKTIKNIRRKMAGVLAGIVTATLMMAGNTAAAQAPGIVGIDHVGINVLSLIKIDASNNMVRYYWNYGPARQPDLISGLDLIILEGGKIRTLNVFIDKLPAANKHQ